MTRSVRLAAVVWLLGSFCAAAQPITPGGPIIVVETSKGSFAIQTAPDEAPASVGHVIDLVRRGFYDGQRVHRVQPGALVQFGDPRSRDVTKRSLWGRGAEAGSGEAVGVVEISPRLSHRRGAVGLAHMGAPRNADSQLYIMLEAHPELDGRYAIIGEVVAGVDVPARLQVGDVITRMSVRE